MAAYGECSIDIDVDDVDGLDHYIEEAVKEQFDKDDFFKDLTGEKLDKLVKEKLREIALENDATFRTLIESTVKRIVKETMQSILLESTND